MFQTQQTKDSSWFYLENDESLELRMSSMKKNLINLMRFLLSSPR
jgi:cystathionine beta-lyase/cystathionine gamma-synthase